MGKLTGMIPPGGDQPGGGLRARLHCDDVGLLRESQAGDFAPWLVISALDFTQEKRGSEARKMGG